MKNIQNGKKRKDRGGPINIELSEKHKNLRIFLVVAFLAVGLTSIGIALFSVLNTHDGYMRIEVTGRDFSTENEFIFNYDFTGYGKEATAARKKITMLYTEASQKAYKLFSKYKEFNGINNIYTLNHRVGDTLEIDTVLYNALKKVCDSGSRHIFYGPIYTEYENLFNSETDIQAQKRDPEKSDELKEYFAEMAKFSSDEKAINIEFMSDNKVKINISDEYRDFANKFEITDFIDFSFMRNAFIIDYFADIMRENNFTNGYFASYDGYTVNMDTRKQNYSLNYFTQLNGEIISASRLCYDKPMSMVNFKDFPLNDGEMLNYYIYKSGKVVHSYIDYANGLNSNCVSSILCYSEKSGCSDIVLKMTSIYTGKELKTEDLKQIKNQNQIYSVWSFDKTIYYQDESISFDGYYEEFKSELVK